MQVRKARLMMTMGRRLERTRRGMPPVARGTAALLPALALSLVFAPVAVSAQVAGEEAGQRDDAPPPPVHSQDESVVDVREFGATGDGTTDDTAAIQEALDEGGVIWFPQGDYLIDGVSPTGGMGGLQVRSDSHLYFDPRSTLRAMPTDSPRYAVLHLRNVENVTIDNATLVGERDEHSGEEGEWGMGLLIYSGRDIIVRNSFFSDFWGDGIYIGQQVEREGPSRDIRLENVVCDNNRRQGMSVISVDGLFVRDSTFKNTGGTAPQAGIDFEPNQSYEVIDNIFISGLRTSNNQGSGILMHLSSLDADSVNMTIRDWHSYRDTVALYGMRPPGGSPTGKITASNVTVRESRSGAVRFADWPKDEVAVAIDNLLCIDINTEDRGGVSMGGLPFTLFRHPGGRTRETGEALGNIAIDGMKVVYTGDVETYSNQYIAHLPVGSENLTLSNVDDWQGIYNLPRLDATRNRFAYQADWGGMGAVTWPGEPGESSVAGHRLRNYGVDTDKPIELLLTDLGEITSLPIVYFDHSGGDDSSLVIRAPEGEVIHPVAEYGEREVILTSRSAGDRVKLQRIAGQWHVIATNRTLANP